MTIQKKITFGSFTIDTENETLLKGVEKIHLRPKTFTLLRHLASQPGLLLTKDELMNAIWPDCNVGEEALKHCIVEIRKALGDNAETPRFIETVHRRGYRFIGKSLPPHKDKAKKQSYPKTGTQDPTPVSSSFVGRKTELAQLERHFEKAMQGGRQIVFVSGEQGIGKTSLVDAFLEYGIIRKAYRPSFRQDQRIHGSPGGSASSPTAQPKPICPCWKRLRGFAACPKASAL